MNTLENAVDCIKSQGKQGKNKFMPYQHNTEHDTEQDGYAGVLGIKIDGLQITLT